jgi:hypothetical protein
MIISDWLTILRCGITLGCKKNDDESAKVDVDDRGRRVKAVLIARHQIDEM